MELPSLERGKSKNQFVAKMSRMLYGLPDSGRNFERYFDKFLRESCGAVPMVVDRSVYKIQTKKGEITEGGQIKLILGRAALWGLPSGRFYCGFGCSFVPRTVLTG